MLSGSHFTMKTQMSFQNACVCDANADQKLTRYIRVHITRRNILMTTNKIVASADRPYLFLGNCNFYD